MQGIHYAFGVDVSLFPTLNRIKIHERVMKLAVIIERESKMLPKLRRIQLTSGEKSWSSMDCERRAILIQPACQAKRG